MRVHQGDDPQAITRSVPPDANLLVTGDEEFIRTTCQVAQNAELLCPVRGGEEESAHFAPSRRLYAVDEPFSDGGAESHPWIGRRLVM